MKKISERDYFFPVEPVPASRPRVSRWGVFYGKRYEKFRKDMRECLREYTGTPLTQKLWVELEFICQLPKQTKRKFPRGDVDNFAKGPLDSMTSHGGFWSDDDQIVCLRVTKRFQRKGEDYGIRCRYGPQNSPAL